MTIRVPRRVFAGINAVRDSGETNMFDTNAVMKIANDMEYYETVAWIHDNKSDYGKGIFQGFEEDDELLPEEQGEDSQ